MKPASVLGIISYKVFPARMGGQKGVIDFYTHLAKQTKITLVVSKDNIEKENIDAPVFPFLFHHKWGFANIVYVFRIRKIIKQQNIDIIFIEHSYMGWMGVLLRWLTKKPFVIHSHNIEAHRFRDMQRPLWRLYELYEKWGHRKADHSFFITEEDRNWAVAHWRLAPEKCTVVTYGTDITEPITASERNKAREQLIQENALDASTTLFLFNGTLDYLPNTDALRIIISELLPLLQPMRFRFMIFICGNRITSQWEEVLRSYPQLIYKGFVENIDLYFHGADCFINPVTLGSGIKIKLMDALAANQTSISTQSGAKGIPQTVTGDKLARVADYDWPAFAQQMFAQSRMPFSDTPAAFYQMFSRDMIVQKALLSLQAL